MDTELDWLSDQILNFSENDYDTSADMYNYDDFQDLFETSGETTEAPIDENKQSILN